MTTRLISTASAAALLLGAAPALAREAPEADVAGRQGAHALGEVVVTATRSPQPVERIGSAVTVLDEKAIKASQAISVADLLALTPAVGVLRNGGPGTVTTVNIRGGEGQHTVVLVDGVKLGDPTATQGSYNFGHLLVGDITRVEVLRGAQSTLWGSQAIGGVVNLVTREPEAPFEATADVEAGARRTAYLRGGVGGYGERLTWRLAGAYFTTDGFSALAAGTEKDGYINAGVTGRARLALTDDISVELRSNWLRGRGDFDGFAGDSPEFGRTEELQAYAGLNVALLDGRLKNRLAYTYADTDRENLNPATPGVPVTFDAFGVARRWEYQGTFAVAEGWNAVFGAERERSRMHVRSPSTFNPNPPTVRGRAGIDSLYAQLQGEVAPGLTLTGGLRHDDHDTFGGHTLGQAAVAWALNGGATVLRASFGQGFRAPGLYELFSEFGNPALDPETFDSWDAGVQQKLLGERASVSATWFHRQADDEIRFNSCFGVAGDPLCAPGGVSRFGYYVNVQKTEAEGIELSGEAQITGAFSLDANYTLTNARNRSGPNAGRRLVRRPEHMGSAQATYVWPAGLSTALQVRYVGESFNNEANTQRVGDYVVVDLRASYPLTDQIEVYGRLENLFDEDYQTVLNFGAPGRGAFVGLRARF